MGGKYNEKEKEGEEVEERGGRKVEKKKKPKGKSPLLQEKKTDAGAHEMERWGTEGPMR